MEDKKVLLSIKELSVKFRVRGRVLTAIRNVSLDIYENETIAIVGESGCGKSVLTKTFAGMLDGNGFIDHGEILFHDDTLTSIVQPMNAGAEAFIAQAYRRLNEYSRLELGSDTYRAMHMLEQEKRDKSSLTAEEATAFESERKELVFKRTELNNLKLTLDPVKEREKIRELSREIAQLDDALKAWEKKKEATIKTHAHTAARDEAYNHAYCERMQGLQSQYKQECSGDISEETKQRNKKLAKEIYLSISRYPIRKRAKLLTKLYKNVRKAMEMGVDLKNDSVLNKVFETAIFRVSYLHEEERWIYGKLNLNLAKSECVCDWTNIRGERIATIFQDPMTSLNPILTIGNQIASVIIKHQHVSESEARRRAIVLMKKVGIPNAENRFDDYPFQYSGGMRQRIVIAIALSCQPKILICDEPTTALDVTIQAQILQLIKDLQKEFHYTTVFITHDLGVVANVADRVAVLYAGQIVEIGTVEEIFYDPRHPYTWVLLSALPQLSDPHTELYSIAGTPPSLYNQIVGDAFAPRNPYCLKVDTLKEPPMFKVSQTHYAKTWLLDPRAPKVEKPAVICGINETLRKVFNI